MGEDGITDDPVATYDARIKENDIQIAKATQAHVKSSPDLDVYLGASSFPLRCSALVKGCGRA